MVNVIENKCGYFIDQKTSKIFKKAFFYPLAVKDWWAFVVTLLGRQREQLKNEVT